MTLVSVLVPTLDAPGLGELVNAVFDQERPGLGVQIVVAGRDATGAATTSSRVTFVGTPSPVSPARARNLAAREAKGELLAFLD
ncbi:MAG: glycosyltransferase, partial [Deltaproteobacteria bacterium]|nr:glycosyltransferase [Deltaproteobacteria bacterium]